MGGIRFRENIDLYLGILISFVVSLLGIFGVVDVRIVTAAILLILLLIAVSILNERWLREELLLKLFRQATWSDIESAMATRLRQARKVKFVGISPLGIIRRYEKELQHILSHEEGAASFIAVNPNKAMDLIRRGRPENFNDGGLFLDEICKQFGTYIESGRLKVKLIDYIPSHIMTLIDDDQQDGIIFATVYSFRQVDPHRPSQVITRREGLSYSFFQEEFKLLWEFAKGYSLCSEKDE